MTKRISMTYQEYNYDLNRKMGEGYKEAFFEIVKVMRLIREGETKRAYAMLSTDIIPEEVSSGQYAEIIALFGLESEDQE